MARADTILTVALIAAGAGVVYYTVVLAQKDKSSDETTPGKPPPAPAPSEGATPRELIQKGWGWNESPGLHKRAAQQAQWDPRFVVGLTTPPGDLRGVEIVRDLLSFIPGVGSIIQELTKGTSLNVIVRVDKTTGSPRMTGGGVPTAGFSGSVDGKIRGMYVAIDVIASVILIGGG